MFSSAPGRGGTVVAERLCCSKGHRWEPVLPADKWPPDFRSSCPVCGEAPLGPSDVTATTGRVLTVLAVGCLVAGLALLLVPPALPGAIVLLIIAGLIPLAFIGLRVVRQRTKKMGQIADAMGFAFMPNLTPSSVRAVAPFRLFKLGHSQKAYNAMQGRVGDRDLMLFEYSYTTGSGKSQHTTQLTAVVLFDGAAGAPDFQLAPKTFIDKVVGLFSHNSVEIEDAGEFSRRCKLIGPDAAALRETFRPELVQHLGKDGRWFIEVAGGQMLAYRQIRLTPEKCPGLVTDALEVRDLLRGADRPSV